MPDPAPAKPSKTRVRAIARGYYGGIIRDPGDEFEIDADDDFGGWMVPVTQADIQRLAPKIAAARKGKTAAAPPGAKPTPAMKLK